MDARNKCGHDESEAVAAGISPDFALPFVSIYGFTANFLRDGAARRMMRAYIVAPSTQGANSAPPNSKLSLLVG